MSEPIHGDSTRANVVAGDGLLHPIALVAIALLVINDHALKSLWPGAVSGKLSDFAGLAFFPLLLQAFVEVATSFVGRPVVASRTLLIACVGATAIVFAAVKLFPWAAQIYDEVLGRLQWTAALLPRLLTGVDVGAAVPVRLVSDPTDLIALPMLAVAYFVGRGRLQGRAPLPT